LRKYEVGAYPGWVKRLARASAFTALMALGACSQAPSPAAAKLSTLFDVQALYAGGAPPTEALAPDDGLPGGVPIGNITTGAAVSPAGPVLTIRSGLADGYGVTYATTEVWSSYAQVWMQPAYVPITGWANGVPQKVVDGLNAWHPIFSVGPQSGFYSPFWQIVYVTVPAGTTTDTFTSARQILQSGYPLSPSQGQTMPLVPDGTTGGGKPGSGYLDGAAISFLNFGTATFTWNDTNVVGEVPIYYLSLIGADGAPHVLSSMPTVLGTSPPGTAPVAPLTVANVPRYSTYWRLYVATVPSFARVFAPPGSQAEADLLAIGVSPGTYTAATTAAALSYYGAYVGRVAVNAGDPGAGIPGCFDDPGLLEHDPTNTQTCDWLDSQTSLETYIDLSTVVTTGISVTCPVISVKSAPVVPL
jgi:hypothetical protein